MLPTENLLITVEFKNAIEIKTNIALLIKTGFQIIVDILSYNMRPLIFMLLCHSVTYVTFFHKVYLKCICVTKLSFCGSAPH